MTEVPSALQRPFRSLVPVVGFAAVSVAVTASMMHDQFPSLSLVQTLGAGAFLTSWLMSTCAVGMVFFGGVHHALNRMVSPQFSLIMALALGSVAIPFLGFLAIIIEAIVS